MNETQYNGWLQSPSLVKRSLAVVGHYMVGQIVILLVIGLPLLLLALLFAGLSR